LVLQPVELAATRANHRARARRLFPLAADDFRSNITSRSPTFFGLGTVRVLTSDVSRAFPIPDAGLGAVAYMIEFLMGFMGDKVRWRTMPWMVTFFGILVVPLGVVSITLIVLQPLAVGAWCTPCLIAAAAMLVMIALTLDEVRQCQFVKAREGHRCEPILRRHAAQTPSRRVGPPRC
jgi:hypothetical protein